VHAVHDVSFELNAGEVLTLLGPSGCGKSTTLRMIAGLEAPDEGEIWVRGRLVASPAARIMIPPERRKVGLVFQSYAIWPHMTAADNIAYPLKLRRVDRDTIASKVAEIIRLVKLDGLGGRMPTELSGGQQQRVALARALVYEPDLLLLDEPLSNLDSVLRKEMRVQLRSLQARLGTTVLYVTHDQEEALAVSDRIAVMRAGRIEQIATPRAIYEQPATPFVAGFIGTTNLLNGSVRSRDGELAEIAFAGTAIRTNCARGNPGESVVMSLRPEALRLLAPGEAIPPGWAALNGRLGEIEYLGPVTRFSVTLADGARLHLMALAPPTMLGAVTVAFDPQRVVLVGAPS
jgi:ABC-type Fe3+/spermidine/putrescine transport system ATPase subunit